MNRFAISALALTAALAAVPASAGVVITSYAADGSNQLPVAGATTNFTFNKGITAEAYDKGYVATVNGVASATDVNPSGTTAAGAGVIAPNPYDGNGYFAIGGLASDGTQSFLTLRSNTALSSISLFIGTLDSYNVVSLLDAAGNVIASYDGTAMNNGQAPFRGAVVPENNRRVTFTGTAGQVFYGARFQNQGDNQAFEFDNLSLTAAVPEPATWAMMLVGFGMVAGAARYRRRATNVRYA